MELRIAACKKWFGEAFCKPEPRKLEVHFVNINDNRCVASLISDRLPKRCCQIQKYYPCSTHGENRIPPLSCCDLNRGASQQTEKNPFGPLLWYWPALDVVVGWKRERKGPFSALQAPAPSLTGFIQARSTEA